MLYYCTLFDSNYISKGIALYLSLERHTDDFLLYVMAMDRKCEKMLKNMDFAHMHVECIEDIETGSLLEAKQNRSRAEYCWTCGSVVTEHFFRTRMLLLVLRPILLITLYLVFTVYNMFILSGMKMVKNV